MGSRRRRVNWTEGARSALHAAIEFVAADSRRSALRVLDDILSAAKSLAELTERGRIVPERGDTSVREVLVGSHRLIYQKHPGPPPGQRPPSPPERQPRAEASGVNALHSRYSQGRR